MLAFSVDNGLFLLRPDASVGELVPRGQLVYVWQWMDDLVVTGEPGNGWQIINLAKLGQ